MDKIQIPVTDADYTKSLEEALFKVDSMIDFLWIHDLDFEEAEAFKVYAEFTDLMSTVFSNFRFLREGEVDDG